MASLLKLAGATALTIYIALQTTTTASAQSLRDTRGLRFMSMAVRDLPPSATEAKEFATGSKALADYVSAWMSSPEHEARVGRYFHDMFGIQTWFFTYEENYYLRTTAEGVYYVDVKGPCAQGAAQNVPAWWKQPGQTVQMCPSSLSNEVYFNDAGGFVGCYWSGGLMDPRCGCGPRQILCVPPEHRTRMADEIRFEFRDRALLAYENDLGWLDLIGGDFVYGSRTFTISTYTSSSS